MSRLIRFSFFALLSSVLLLMACGHSADVGAEQRTQTALTALKERDVRHYNFSTNADMGGLRDETASYSQDMDQLMGEMGAACDAMMSSGMMGMHDKMPGMMGMHDKMPGMMDRMRSMIRDHQARMGGMENVDSMRSECQEHHRMMGGMLGCMDGMMKGAHDMSGHNMGAMGPGACMGSHDGGAH